MSIQEICKTRQESIFENKKSGLNESLSIFKESSFVTLKVCITVYDIFLG